MLARSRHFVLRSGAKLRTPLLIPSVSSKGFAFRDDGLSEVATYLEVVGDALTEALLVSAYDLHYRYLPDADRLLAGQPWSTVYSNPALLVVDSGGYELSPLWEESAPVRGVWATRPFDSAAYAALIDRIPTTLDILVVTYDHVQKANDRPSYVEQVAQASAFLDGRDHVMSDVLLRPPGGETYLDPVTIEPAMASLRRFDVVGVTEKEAGNSVLARLVTIARLRRLLDEGGVPLPIHVFGVLDPLLVTLYFMAGAEVFDGLSWLRFGNHRGVSVYREAAAVLSGHIDVPSNVREALSQADYLAVLRVLKRRLRRWVETGGNAVVLESYQSEIDRVRVRLEEALGERIV